MHKKLLKTFLILAVLVVHNAIAQQPEQPPLPQRSQPPMSVQDTIADLGHRWAAISYQTPAQNQESSFDALAKSAAQAVTDFPGKAEPLVWHAIILSSEAKVQGGLGALSKVKEARRLLLEAEKIDPSVLGGSIYSSLGSLYAKVPGWPIGYGDKKIAAEYLQKALVLNANSIDANYFYADLLAEQGEYQNAVEHLQKAIAAPARPGRADADAGRRSDAKKMLAAIREKYGNKISGL